MLTSASTARARTNANRMSPNATQVSRSADGHVSLSGCSEPPRAKSGHLISTWNPRTWAKPARTFVFRFIGPSASHRFREVEAVLPFVRASPNARAHTQRLPRGIRDDDPALCFSSADARLDRNLLLHCTTHERLRSRRPARMAVRTRIFVFDFGASFIGVPEA